MSSENSWSLSMHQIECCNCSHRCGCQFVGFPDSKEGNCSAMLGHQVIKGHLNGLDLSGLKMVFIAMWPKAIHEDNGKGAYLLTLPLQVNKLPHLPPLCLVRQVVCQLKLLLAHLLNLKAP